ncbi:maltokinase N-terminal cap-like domain-containing protein [Sanguibacter antarcticus]|uniref:maltokinase N-terminal cap-like domain-containing protein n=1 Tax=Sanguibacter antarcticus TaxID=372484 RepID=UPI00117A2E1B|nr:aminoglycoside phosphotransferase [Sanguibacter antarcticus]
MDPKTGHDGVTLDLDDGEILRLLEAWLPSRRWYPAKGVDVVLSCTARIPMPSDAQGGRQPFIAIVRARREGAGGVDVTLQVPLVLEQEGADPAARPAGPVVDPSALVGTTSAGRLYDGAQHPAFWSAWLDAATWAEEDRPARQPYDFTGAHILSVEQSNSSVLLPRVAGGTMLKILRTLAPGDNPDVVVPLALTRAGWHGVPTPYAWHELTIDDPEGSWRAHAGVLAELVPDATDGFELACSLAADGRPFNGPARELGTQVAQMHSALRRAFVDEVRDVDPAWLLDALRRRVRSASSASAAVRERATEIEAFLAHMSSVTDDAVRQGRPLPPVQRIHGDLHLGQALYSPQTGWRILDFEGEPLRPLRERTRPDLGERDVTGMLRSFDYAAAVGHAGSTEWARAARRAFLEGYNGYLTVPGALGFGQRPSLADRVLILDSFELDKALYEVVYEERNRPDWTHIPLAAIDRILGR